jgi:integrase
VSTTASPAPAAETTVRALLPAVLEVREGDGDELAVTDTLLTELTPLDDLDRLLEGLADLLAAASAPATRRAYAADWADFARWSAEHHLEALPASPMTVGLYLQARQEHLALSSLLRRLAAIAVRHREARAPDPTRDPLVRTAVAGLRRTHPRRRPAGKRALVSAQLSVIASQLDARTHPFEPPAGGRARDAARAARRHQRAALAATRDRALLLLGYAAALRRSELVALTIGDVVEVPQGLQVHIAASKTDQTGIGVLVGIAHGHPAGTCAASCPVRAVADWRSALAAALGLAGPEDLPADAPLFRAIDRHGALGSPTGGPQAALTDRSVARIVQDAVALLGDAEQFPPAAFGGHSLRAGLVTELASRRVPAADIMRQTRHSSHAMVMRYIRPATLFDNNPTTLLGL